VKKSTPKRYTQRQLTQIFIKAGDIPVAEAGNMQIRWWQNPTDVDSLRLSLQGLQFVKAILKMQSYEFSLPDELTNHNLLQLERYLKGPYYLLKRQKIIVFEEEEALMLTLHGNNLKAYLDNLENINDIS
jgi:hypothetical protein